MCVTYKGGYCMKQSIVSIGREFGSAGHEIAQMLSEHYNLPLYDHNMLDQIASEKKISAQTLKEFDEEKRNKILYRSIKGMNSSPQYNVAHMQFEFLKERAKSGESFVVVGRCSETILKEYEGLISIFITGNMDAKVERIMELYNKTEQEAVDFIHLKDKKRKEYHNSFCKNKWGDSRYYDLTLNSNKLGIDQSIQFLIQYIDARMKQ